MTNIKLFTLEKILFLVVFVAVIFGFWYFEESTLLRTIIIGLSLVGLFLAVRKKKSEHFSSRFELLSLLILYLGAYTVYNALYSMSIPIYATMVAVMTLVVAMFYSTLSLDEVSQLLPKEIFRSLIVLLGLVILEIFLGLYFWPIDPEVKSLVLVVVYYLIFSLIYLYIHSMLRLKKILGYLVVSVIILVVITLEIWLRLPK